MSEAVQFSGVVRLPAPITKPNWLLAAGFGLLLPLGVLVFVFNGARIPSWLNPGTWQWTGYAVAFAVLGVPMMLIRFAARRATLKHTRARMNAWCAQAPRSSAEKAAADFHVAMLAGKRERAAAVSAFLQTVPASHSRVIVAGDVVPTPTDDGLLYEEADALEGRIQTASRWLLLVLVFPLGAQFMLVVTRHGINLFYWTSDAWPRLIPAAISAALIALTYGIVRAPGKAAIASPRRVQHTAMGKQHDFTCDNSILFIWGGGPQLTVSLNRNDGVRTALFYPNEKAAGFRQMISRWCMIAPRGAPVRPTG